MRRSRVHRKNVGAIAALVLGGLVATAGCRSPEPADEGDEKAPRQAPDAPAAEKGKQAAPAPEHPPDDKGGAGPAGGNPILDELAKDMTLRQQEQKALCEHYKKTGKNFYERFDYKEAAKNFDKAVQADPNDREARMMLYRAQLLAGDRQAEFKAVSELLREEKQVGIEQEKIELKRLFQEGQDLLSKGEHEKAIARFEMVLEKIRWFPYPIDNGDLEKSSRSFILQAKKAHREREIQERQAREERALKQAIDEETNRRDQERHKVKELLARAIEDIDAQNYEKADKTLDEVLERDPSNDVAQKYKEIALEGRHLKSEDTLFKDLHREEKDNQINNEEVSIPYLDKKGVIFPDKQLWLTKISRRKTGIAPASAEEPAWIQDYKKILRSRKVRLNFPQTPFQEAINFLQDLTGLNFVVSKAIDAEQIKVNVRLNDVSVESALTTILDLCNPPLTLTFKEGVIMIVPKDDKDAKGEYYLDIYDVQDILAAMPDFPGPRMKVNAGRGGGGGARGGGAGSLTFDDDEQESEGQVIEADKLEGIIKNSTGGDDKWGEPASYELHRGQVIVNQTKATHDAIRKVLENLRRNTGLFVQVETRFIVIHNDFLQDIGVDYRGLGNSPNPTFGTAQSMDPFPNESNRRGGDDIGFGRKVFHGGRASPRRLGPVVAGIPFFGSSMLGGRVQNILEGGDAYFQGTRLNNTAVSAQNTPLGLAWQSTILDPFQINAIIRAEEQRFKEKIVTAPVVVAANRQRVHISVVTQRAYISDYELSSGGTGLVVAEVADPIIQTFQEGIVLDVRPTISADRKYVTLDVRPTLATLVGGQFKEIPVNLGTISRAAINVNIEVPEITLQEAYTSVTIPDGGTALVGGFRQFNEKQQRSGIPFVDNVPLLNVLFKREAELRETESIVILMQAKIIALREEEKKRFNAGK